MQPKAEKPVVKKPDFAKADKPTFDYRNMENAGRFRGVGQRGKTGLFERESGSIQTMPPLSSKSTVRRDHEG